MKRIAIIGSGVGGSSLAYYLSKTSDHEIVVYEKNKVVGGRVQHTTLKDTVLETGAGFFHAANRNIMDLVGELDLEIEELTAETFGLWNGGKMVYSTSPSSLLTNLKLLFRFGFNLLSLQSAITQIKENITQFYDEGKTFESIPEMIKLMNFEEVQGNTIEQVLQDMGIKEKIISELAIPACHYIYHQCGKRSMNGFAGFVSLIASDDEPIYYINNGNRSLCEKLIDQSQAILHLETSISAIKKMENGYELTSSKGKEIFDKVVIFTPLEISDIQIQGIKTMPSANRTYYPYVKTLIAGKINNAYFGTNRVPEMVLIAEGVDKAPETKMYGMSMIDEKDDSEIWTISGPEKIPKDYLEQIFAKIDEIREIDVYYTYPDLEPIAAENFDPLILDHNLYYGNCVDSLSPTMESSIIVAKNISQLL